MCRSSASISSRNNESLTITTELGPPRARCQGAVMAQTHFRDGTGTIGPHGACGRALRKPTTVKHSKVTCGSCQRSHAYRSTAPPLKSILADQRRPEPDRKDSLGSVLEGIRTHKGLSRRQFAEKVDISTGKYITWIHSRVLLTSREIERVAIVFGVGLSYNADVGWYWAE